MKPFLQHIAEYVLSCSPKEIERITILFPNRRSVQFLKFFLKNNNNGKALILPRIQAIDDFVTSAIPFSVADALSVNATLFSIFHQSGIQNESYDLFYSWGEMLVRDFDELDKYLADPNQLFRLLLGEKEIASQFAYLEEEQIKAIQRFWSTFNPDKITREQDLFLTLWKSLPEIYQKLNHQLSATGRTYLGHAYRLLAEDPARYLNRLFPENTQFLIAGFNRITPAEAAVFSFLRKRFQVSFYWDVDTHYTESIIHEAGYFYRKYSSRFPSVLPPLQNINSDNKKITLYNCSKFVVQAQQTAQLIKEIKNKNESIAIILHDESRLPILLPALADEEDVNITMGIQIRNSLTASFISQWLELQRFVRKVDEKIFYHITKINQFIHHPLLLSMYDEDTRVLWKEILKNSSENLISLNLLPNEWEHLKKFLIPPTDGLNLLRKLKDFFYEYIQIVSGKEKLTEKKTKRKAYPYSD